MNRFLRRLLAPLAALALAATAAAASLAVDDSKIIVPGASTPAGGAAAGAASGLGSVSLVLGLALAAVGGWFVWRGRHGNPIGRETRQLTISETRSLGSRQYLVVASYEDKKFLLGVCPGRIDLLAPLHEPSTAEKPRA